MQGTWDSGLAALSHPDWEARPPFPKGFHPQLGPAEVRWIGGAIAQPWSGDQLPGNLSGTQAALAPFQRRHQTLISWFLCKAQAEHA